jgi:hypothetical protein
MRYGRLEIPAADIRRIDFAARLTVEKTERINLLVTNLNHPDFDSREKAMAELRGIGEQAYPFLVKAIKNPDAEIARRAEESVKFITARTVAAKLEPREFDVIVTDASKYTCTIIPSTLRVRTGPFGDQTMKLTDVTTLSSGPAIGVTLVNAPAAPGNLMAFQNQPGKELAFTITAPSVNNVLNVWGTDVYRSTRTWPGPPCTPARGVQVEFVPPPMDFPSDADLRRQEHGSESPVGNRRQDGKRDRLPSGDGEKGYVDRVASVTDGQVIATHQRSYGRREKVLDPTHFWRLLNASRRRSITPRSTATGYSPLRSPNCGATSKVGSGRPREIDGER